MAIRSWMLVMVACFAMAAASGCCCINACGPIGGCGVIDSGCGDCNSYAGADDYIGDPCGGCGLAACCCDPCCAYGGWGPGPVLRLLRFVRQSLVCGVGCGGVYWGEWLGDPPVCQDPCGAGFGVGVGWGACADNCGGGCTGGCEIVSDSGCTGGCEGCASNARANTSYASAPRHAWGSPGYTTACQGGNCQNTAHVAGGTAPPRRHTANRTRTANTH